MKKVKKTISSIVVFTYLFSISSLVIPQLGVQALAATTTTMNNTFETTDPNFGSFATGTSFSYATLPTMIAVESTGTAPEKTNVFDTKIVKDATGNRELEVTVPKDKKGKTRFYYNEGSAVQSQGNAYSFEGSFTFSNQAKEFNLNVIPGDWGANLPLIKFLTTGEVQVRAATSSTGSKVYVNRGTWAANTKYIVKIVMYKDTDNYDAFITSAGKTTMIASGEALYDYGTPAHKFLSCGLVYFNMEAVGTEATESTTVTYDEVKLGYSSDQRNTFIPASDATALRTTTFETNDADSKIAATATGAAIDTNILGNGSTSLKKIVANADGGRSLEVTAPVDKIGDLSFPIYADWQASPMYKSYTLEADFTMKDNNADYLIKLVTGNWGPFKPTIVMISKDGNIYARSTNDEFEGMAARATWTVGETFSLKIVTNIDTMSYDLYCVKDGVSKKLVNNEPLEASTLYTTGLATFKMYVSPGTHDATTVLVDNVKLSSSNIAGTAPIINASPGTLYNNDVVVGDPISYYVSPTGLDTNDGKSATTPYKTPQKAADLSMPGDTIYFMEGIYTSDAESILNIKTSGSLNNPITYKAYNDEKPIFRLDKGWNVVSINANYIVIDGIGVEGNAKNVTLAQAEAVYAYYIDYIDRGKALGEVLDRDYISTTNTNGITFNGTATNPIHHLVIKNCEVANMPAGGIGGSKADYVTIENNNIHDNCIWDMYATSGISVLGSIDIDANKTDYKIVIRNNISSGNISHIKWSAVGVRRMSDSNGCILDYNSNANTGGAVKAYAGRFLVENNKFYENGGSGFHAFESSNADVINNTIYNNNQNPALKTYSNMYSSSGVNNRFLNNIVYAGPNDLITKTPEDSTVIFANNIYYGSQAPAYMGKNDKFIDPKFVDLAAKDFHLVADSPAIDQGTKTIAPTKDSEGNVRPRGNGFDIGAYESEYASTTPLVDNVLDLVAMAQSTFVYGAAVAVKGTPIIDGDIDNMWDRAQKFSPNKYVLGNLNNVYATADAKVMWDDNNLYVLAIVKDPVLSNLGTQPYFKDSVEAFLDQNNAKTTNYDAAPDDGQYRVDFNNVRSGSSWFNETTFNSATKVTEDGYIVEMVIPFATTAVVGRKVGFDFQINDCDVTGTRQAIKTWSDPLGKGYSNTSKWGTVTLVQELTSTAATVAAGITSVVPPAKDATSLTLPVVPAGYTIAIKSATPTGTIEADKTITPPVAATTVAMVFTVTKTSDNTTADTASINVVVPAKTLIDKAALTTAISDATTLIGSTKVGGKVGNVHKKAKTAYQSKIDEAKAVNTNTAAIQSEVDDEVETLSKATIDFNNAVVKDKNHKKDKKDKDNH